MPPLYQLCSSALLRKIVGTLGTIKVLLPSYPVNKCIILEYAWLNKKKNYFISNIILNAWNVHYWNANNAFWCYVGVKDVHNVLVIFPAIVTTVNIVGVIAIRLFRIMSIPTTFRLFRVLTSEFLGRRLPVFTLLLWQRQHMIVVDAVDYK